MAELYSKDSVQAAFLSKIIQAINKVGASAGVNPVGNVQPPPAVDNVNVATSGETMQVTLNHNHPVNKPINYFVEVATNPNFAQPLVHHLGPSRSSVPFTLPSKDSKGNTHQYYVRAYCQYLGSKPSTKTAFGGPLAPQAISMGGSTQMDILPSTGSGTSSPTGQQGGQGFGNVQNSFKLGGPIQASIGAATPQGGGTPVTPSSVGSLDMPASTFIVGGALPLTAEPQGGPIVVTFAPQPPGQALLGPEANTGRNDLDVTETGNSGALFLATGTLATPIAPSSSSNEWAILVCSAITALSSPPTYSTPAGGWAHQQTAGAANGMGESYFINTTTSELPIVGFTPNAQSSLACAMFFSAGGPPTTVQDKIVFPLVGGATINPTSAVTAGNGMIVLIEYVNAASALTGVSVVSALGNNFVLIADSSSSGGGEHTHCQIWYAEDIIGGTETITIAASGGGGAGAAYFMEISGLTSLSSIPTWRFITNTDLENAAFGAAGSFHSGGAVPDPGAVVHTPPHMLGDDGSFDAIVNEILAGANITVSGPTGNVTVSANITGGNGTTWTSGTGAPAGTPVPGSIYSRTSGGVGTSFYVYNGTAWVAVA